MNDATETTEQADTDTTTVDPLLTETADRLLGELCSHDAVQAAENEGHAPAIWQAFAETGFPRISVPEAAGGSGGSLADAMEVLRVVGSHAAPLPAAETGVLGGWLLASAGLTLPEDPNAIVTVAPGTRTDELTTSVEAGSKIRLQGTVHRVPWARAADRLALLVDVGGQSMVASVVLADCSIDPMTNMAGEPRDSVSFGKADQGLVTEAAPAPAAVTKSELHFRGALSRTALMAGAIEKMSQLTVSYTNERMQFGRPVARFQAVQQHLVWAAQDAALVRMAAESARREAMRRSAYFEIASAKLLANQGAARATKACHQAHGAMGMTQEYPLHHYSRRLWSWRKEFGSERHWKRWLADVAVDAGADGLYPLIASGSAAN